VPGSLRLYVGGDAPVAMSNIGSWHAVVAIFAPKARLDYVGSLNLLGAAWVRELNGVGAFDLTFARPGSADGQECGPLPPVIEDDPPAEDEPPM
jgi:hypothetical protein